MLESRDKAPSDTTKARDLMRVNAAFLIVDSNDEEWVLTVLTSSG